ERGKVVGPHEIVILTEARPIPRPVDRTAGVGVIAQVDVFAKNQGLDGFLVGQRGRYPATRNDSIGPEMILTVLDPQVLRRGRLDAGQDASVFRYRGKRGRQRLEFALLGM